MSIFLKEWEKSGQKRKEEHTIITLMTETKVTQHTKFFSKIFYIIQNSSPISLNKLFGYILKNK